MRILILICIFLFLIVPVHAEDELFDEEIILSRNMIKFDDFSSKYIKDIDIENFIKKELKNDYVMISLDECLDVALKNNFNIKITNHNYKSSNYEYQYALSQFMPILGVNAYINDYRGQLLVGEVLSDNLHETAISVSLMATHKLTEGGKQIFEAKAKRYFAKSRRHNYNYTKSQVLYLTAKYYYELVLAKENIEIYLRNLIERNAQLTLSESLASVGFGTRFDVVRSKNETAQAKIALLKALNNFRDNQAALAEIMGIKVETALMPIEHDVTLLELIDSNLSTETLFELALKNREDLKNYNNLIKYEKNVRNTYYTDFIPKPYVTFEERFQGTVDTKIAPNYMLSLNIDWIPGQNTALGTLAKLRSQKENIKIAKLELINKLRNIQKDIITYYTSSKYNKKEVLTSQKRVEYSQESIKLAMGRFYNGQGILLDVIEAQSEMTLSRVEYINSKINYNISQLELSFATGIITKEMIVKNYKP